jgi:hypothetical protein
VKEMIQYVVNAKNEQHYMLPANKMRVFAGFLLLQGYRKKPSE